MALELDFIKLPSRGHVKVAFGAPGTFANPYWPTATELNSNTLNLSPSISWNDYDFGIAASNTTDDPSFADVGAVQSRGATQYGGGISFYLPGANDDDSNNHSLVQDAIGQRTAGFIAIRIDGDKLTSQPFAAGDFIHIFQILTAGEALSITGEEAFRVTQQFLQQGVAAVYSVVGTTSTPVVVATPITISAAPGDVGRIAVTVNGRRWTNGCDVSSSDSDVLTIRKGGVWRALEAGTSTITVSVPNSTANDTIAATVA